MIALLIVLIWICFISALSLTVYPAFFPEEIKTIAVIVVSPVLAASCLYLVLQILPDLKLNEKTEGRVRRGSIAFGIFLGAGFVFFNNYPYYLQIGICVCLGFLAFALSLWFNEMRTKFPQDDRRASFEDWIFRGSWLVFVASVIAGFFSGMITSPVIAVSIILFGSLTLYFTLYTASFLLAGHSFAMESNWGGLGAGMGGWRVSRPLVFLLLAVFFGWATISLITHAAGSAMQIPQVSGQAPEILEEKSEDETNTSGGKTESSVARQEEGQG